MKKIGNTILILVVVAAIFSFFFLYRQNVSLKDEKSKHEAILDSIKAVKAMPPDTVFKDTIIVSTNTITFSSQFDDLPEIDDYSIYQDSIVNDSIRVWADIRAKELYQIDWKYTPVIYFKEKEITKFQPVVVPEYIEKEIFNRGLYLTSSIGFGDQFAGTVGFSYMPSNKYSLGLQLIQIGDQKAFGISGSFRLW